MVASKYLHGELLPTTFSCHLPRFYVSCVLSGGRDGGYGGHLLYKKMQAGTVTSHWTCGHGRELFPEHLFPLPGLNVDGGPKARTWRK